MTIDDATVYAYVDGELDADAAGIVERAAGEDAALAARIRAARELRATVTSAFAPVLDEPVPGRLTELVAAPSDARVIDLASRRAHAEARRAWRWQEFGWGALAASVVVGIASALLLREPGQSIEALADGRLVARGALAAALSEQLASTQPADARVRVVTSFAARDGSTCRTFVVRTPSVAGLACRDADRWSLRALVEVKGISAEYRPAGGDLPPAIARAVEGAIAGEPFDAAAERAARERGWR